ncbi:MAG: hypothetical protein M1820_001151 [Bogoriella megaspora]|nr:MAG: hypothetical protein M1820_001151 [Bogoriella megaspora]
MVRLLNWLLATGNLAARSDPKLGIKLGKGADTLPTITLPNATYRATRYDSNADIYTFKNIRFGAPPTGPLRWALPNPPEKNDTLQDGSYGPSCIQSFPKAGLDLLGAGNESPIGGAANQFLGGIPASTLSGGDEDCLFLDVFIPGKAVRSPRNYSLPIVVWIPGGAYSFGSKDHEPEMFYGGGGLVEQSGGNIIFVSGNYRLGAYGWLAGSTVESDGTPNVGLHDQRAVFQWVQNYAHLFGGDKKQVSAWGESAGASSIMHHLIARGGAQDPLFRKAVLQSPAFEIMYDRRGKLEESFEILADGAGCADQGLDCLRRADAAILEAANTVLQNSAPDGGFAVGPAADGALIRQLPALEFTSGNFWKDIDSLIISHTADEAELFVDGHIQTDDDFYSFIRTIFPNYAIAAGLDRVIESRYPNISSFRSKYTTQTDRVKDFVRDSSFTTNTRFVTEAYAGKTYNMQYSVTPGWHATDLIPLFLHPSVDVQVLNETLAVPLLPIIGSYAKTYQSYFTSHARTGNPNSFAELVNFPPAIAWEKVSSTNSEYYTDVLYAGDSGFSYTRDQQNPKSAADFWVQLQAAVTNLGGYAPPGAVVEQDLLEQDGRPSARYETPEKEH